MDEYFTSNNTQAKEVPSYVTYLNLVFILILNIVVITPVAMVVNVIRKTKELHTVYYFFVANLLGTNIAGMIAQGILQYLIMILYLFDVKLLSVVMTLKWSVLLLVITLHMMIALQPITLAVERMVVIGFPHHHRSVMTTKAAATMLATFWGLSLSMAVIIIITVQVNIVWPLGLVDVDYTLFPFIMIPRLLSAIFIAADNVFLQYKITQSSRKTEENETLGNEEEARRHKTLTQLLKAKTGTTMTLILIASIDVIGNMLILLAHVVVIVSAGPNKEMYIKHFLLYPLKSTIVLLHPLVYGLCMKKIRRSPSYIYVACQQFYINYCRKSEVIVLNQ